MDMARDMKPDVDEMYNLARRIEVLVEMTLSLQERRRSGEISHIEYMNGLDMVERLSR